MKSSPVMSATMMIRYGSPPMRAYRWGDVSAELGAVAFGPID
jgi:hypothetical protein